MKFEISKEYSFRDIEEAIMDTDHVIDEHGHGVLGQSFLVLIDRKGNSEDVHSFVLVDYHDIHGNIYKLIYKDNG